MTSSRRFAHLHIHSDHSNRDGAGKVEEYVRIVAENGQPALAITDHGTTSGSLALVNAARQHGIKPIVGMEGYISPEPGKAIGFANGTNAPYYHVTLLAATRQGYRNLVTLDTLAHDKQLELGLSRPVFSINMLEEYRDGVIVLTGCLSGMLLSHIVRDRSTKRAAENLAVLTDIFDNDHLFVEIMSHGIPDEDKAHGALVELSKRAGLRLVGTNDSHFAHRTQSTLHEAHLALGENKSISSPNRWHFDGEGYWVKSADEMWHVLNDKLGVPAAFHNTLLIASMVEDSVIPEPRTHMPRYRFPDGTLPESADKLLQERVRKGLAWRYPNGYGEDVRARLNQEYKVITGKGFSDYFLIVQDMIDFARSQGILVGPGRGSAAGSLIAYVLGITDIDPLRYDLLFERFLNPDRKDWPDIDVDFDSTRRDEVVRWLGERFGFDNVAHIGTRGVERSRSAIRNAARFYESPIGETISKLMPIGADGKPEPLSKVLDPEYPDDAVRSIVEQDPDAQKVVELAKGLEGLYTAMGIHACGIVISDEPIIGVVPMRRVKDKPLRVAMWDQNEIAHQGLLKIDTLALSALGVMGHTVDLIRETKDPEFSLDTLPDPDDLTRADVRKAWQLISSGDTNGIFQLESSGMQQLCQSIAPSTLNELGVVIALFRPGPMGQKLHARYAELKEAKRGADYSNFTDDPDETEAIDTVLSTTLGIPVFQEQIMALSGVVAGFKPSARERVRKAVAKKIAAEMEEVGRLFLEGALKDVDEEGNPKQVFSPETAQRLWDAIKSAGAYAFNKSHALAYARLGWMQAYLRANFPVESAAGMIRANADRRDKLVPAIRSVMRQGVRVLPPDVNRAQMHPTIHDDAVVLGFDQIKLRGGKRDMLQHIITSREANGPFVDYRDFTRRVTLNHAMVLQLAESGAFDSIIDSRYAAVLADQALRLDETVPIPAVEWSQQEIAWREAERLGLTLTVDLVKSYARKLKADMATMFVDDMIDAYASDTYDDLYSDNLRVNVSVIGVVEHFNLITKGARRANLVLAARGQTVDAVIWSRTLDQIWGNNQSDALRVGDIVLVSGQLKMRSITRETDEVDDDGNPVEQEERYLQLTANNVQRIQVAPASWRIRPA